MRYIAIPGTWGWDEDGDWWTAGSRFAQFMDDNDCHLLRPDDPFLWSTDIDGTWFDRVFRHGRRFPDWEAGAKALQYYMRDVPYGDRNVIAHSHGGQLAALAAGRVPLRRLVTVCTPYRKDLDAIYSYARKMIGHWEHVHSDSTDLMQLAGSLFDGYWGFHRRMPHADINTKLPKVGHTGILRDPALIPEWRDAGIIARLRQGRRSS